MLHVYSPTYKKGTWSCLDLALKQQTWSHVSTYRTYCLSWDTVLNTTVNDPVLRWLIPKVDLNQDRQLERFSPNSYPYILVFKFMPYYQSVRLWHPVPFRQCTERQNGNTAHNSQAFISVNVTLSTLLRPLFIDSVLACFNKTF